MSTLDRFFEPMRNYWHQRTVREQWIVSTAVALALVAVAYQGMWRPMHKSIDTLRVSVPEARRQLAQMRIQAKGIPQTPVNRVTEGLLPTLEKTLDTYNIREQLQRMEPDGDAAARVSMNNVNYIEFVKWLVNLQRQYGIRIDSARLNATNTDGFIDARVTLTLAK